MAEEIKAEYRNDSKGFKEMIATAKNPSDIIVPSWGWTIHEYLVAFEKLKEMGVNPELMDEKIKELEEMRPDDPYRLHYIIQP